MSRKPWKPLIPERLSWSECPAGVRYELWRTPQMKHGWCVYRYERGVQITATPCATDIAARDEFERRVAATYSKPTCFERTTE